MTDVALRDRLRPGFTAVAWLLCAAIVAEMAVMLGCLALQVFMRYVLSSAPSWTEELAILMFVWVTLGVLALGVREGFHVRLGTLAEHLPTPAQKVLGIAIDLLTVVFGGYLAWSGWRFVDFTRGSVSPAIGYPIEVLHGMAPLSGVLVALFALERLLLGPARPLMRGEPQETGDITELPE